MRLFSLFLLCVCLVQVKAQELSFQTYSVRDGLAQSQVYCLLQDSRGFLWAGTQGGGLCRFDGNQFKTYTTRLGLSGNYVNALAEDHTGRLWIGTDKGITSFNGKIFITLPESVFKGPVSVLHIDSRGLLWIGGDSGVAVFDTASDILLQTASGLAVEAVLSLAENSEGIVLIGTISGIRQARVSEGKIHYNPEYGDRGMVSALAFDEVGNLWVSFYGEGIVTYGISDSTSAIPGLSNTTALALTPDPKGGMWIGSLKQGLLHYHNGELLKIDDRSGLPNNQVRSVLVDDWGNVWAGTSGGGLARYFGQRNVYLNKDTGLPGRQVYSLCEDRNQVIWMGVADKGVVRLRPGSSIPERDSLLQNGKVKALHCDSRGRVWAGTEGEGLRIYEEDTSYVFSVNEGLSGAWVKAIEEDSLNQMWIATAGGGISRLSGVLPGKSGTRVKIFNTYNGLSDDRVNALCADSLNRMWFGTENKGVGVILPDETIIHFDPDSFGYGRNVRSIAQDGSGWLWIGTGDAGLARIDLRATELSVQVPEEPVQPGLGNVYLIQPDLDGNVWVGTGNGLFRYLTGESGSLTEPELYDESGGFHGVEACSNASLISSRSELWIGTVDGVNCLYPESKPSEELPPKIRMEQISLFYKPLEEVGLGQFIGDWGIPADTLVLTYEQNHLSFSMQGLHLSDPRNLLYQWMLEGADSNWTPALKLNTATFSQLKPGSYTFRYRACTENGSCSPESTVAITILRPYWQEFWFQAGIGAAGLVSVILFAMWRIMLIKRRSREKNQRLKLQNKVLELEQQALRMQMNPHFIFNTLNSIQGLIALKDSKEARRQLSAFSRLMRTILENSREELIPLEEEIKACETYVELERSARGLDFEFNVMNACPENTFIPPLLLQPFIENAILHGITGLSRRGVISLEANVHNHHLVIQVSDNGKGRNKALPSGTTHHSLGVRVTRERLEKAGEGSSLVYTDLLDEQGEAAGTRVVIRIPITDLQNFTG